MADLQPNDQADGEHGDLTASDGSDEPGGGEEDLDCFAGVHAHSIAPKKSMSITLYRRLHQTGTGDHHPGPSLRPS